MRKNILPIIIVLAGFLFSLNANATSFKLAYCDSVKYGGVEEEILAGIKLNNPGFAPIEISSFVKIDKLTAEHEYSVCDASGICGPYTKNDYIPESTFELEPVATTDFIYIHLQPNKTIGEDNFTVKYWRTSDSTDYLIVKLRFFAGISDVQVENHSSFGSIAFPTIANDNLSIKLDNSVDNASLEIFNSYGNNVASQKINGDLINFNTNELAQGSYYYNIIKNSSVISRNNFVVVR
jgi:hypothetical protein